MRGRALVAIFVALGAASCSAILGFEDLTGPDGVPDSGGPPPGTSDAAPNPTVTVTVTASQATSTFGSPVTFTAVVAGGAEPATGNVTFSEGATTLEVRALVAGQGVSTGTHTTASLAAGPHTITATYGGDATHPAGAVGSVSHTVNKVATTTTLASAPNPSTSGQPVSLTATVTAAAGPITGVVTFTEDLRTLGSAPVGAAGTATFTTDALAGGTHRIVASYGGSASFGASASAPHVHAVAGPRCAGVASTCGPSGTDDCCAAATVPGGTFKRSYDGTTLFNDARFDATVSPFRLDTYEITVGRFRAFVQAGRGTRANPPAVGEGAHPLLGAASGWQAAFTASLAPDTASLLPLLRCSSPNPGATWTDVVGTDENKPMNCLTWYEVMAFCAWDGGRVPTEAEWNFAAAGGSEQRAYPWSSPASDLTVDLTFGTYSALGAVPVGSKPKGNGRWGHADLGGNVWEWVLDWRANYTNPCTDCATITGSGNKVFRGGGWVYTERDMRASHRGDGWHVYRGVDVGGRCARAL